ncbi:hypothetical protein ACTFIT_007818 [Dictyostelium discoideum]
MYPNVNHQILAGTVLNMGIEIIIIAPLFGKMDCIFEDESSVQTIPFDKSSNSCVLPYTFKNEGSFNVRVTLSLNNSGDSVFQYLIYSFYSGWAMIDSNIEKEIIIDGNIFKKGCQQQVLGNCTISTNSKLITGLPNVTESDELNRLFSSESSLLSIYVENQPIFLLEPLQSNLDSTFKNLTFHYENLKSQEIINISFTTRGDIYLTSMAVYSSAIPIIVTPTPKTSKTTSKNKLKIALPICLFALLVAVGVLIYGSEMSSIKISVSPLSNLG